MLLPEKHNKMFKIQLIINNCCATDLASKGKNNIAHNVCEYAEIPM